MDDRAERRRKAAQEIVDNIEKHGCHVISVLGDDDSPAFSYSTGLGESANAPEAIVIGVRPHLGKSMIDAYQQLVLEGVRFEPSRLHDGLLGGGFQVYVEPVATAAVKDWMYATFTHYGARPFSVVQIVYPTVNGAWPWEEAVSDWFLAAQPMLGRPRLDVA